MKKQFFRVKQLADQTFSRAGKTNALSDDLQDADRKTEFIKNACQIVAKKMSACLLLGASASDANVPFKDRKEKALVNEFFGKRFNLFFFLLEKEPGICVSGGVERM